MMDEPVMDGGRLKVTYGFIMILTVMDGEKNAVVVIIDGAKLQSSDIYSFCHIIQICHFILYGSDENVTSRHSFGTWPHLDRHEKVVRLAV